MPYGPVFALLLMTFAGLPATIEFGGTSFVTTAPAPTTEPFPTVIPGKMVLRAPMKQLLPMRVSTCSPRVKS
jgi:hypothetical protein